MPCHAAMTDKLLLVQLDDTAEHVLKQMRDKKLDMAIVVDENNVLRGTFSYHSLLKNVSPLSVPLSDGIQLDVKVPAGPGIAKRLKNVQVVTMDKLLEQRINVAYPETPIWEAVNMVVQSRQPIIIIDKDTQKVLGIVDANSIYEELNRLKDS